MDFVLRSLHPPEGDPDDPFIAFIAALTEEERAVVDRDALVLTKRLIEVIMEHSQAHPQIPDMVWLHAVSALFRVVHGMATGVCDA
jgi:hypothetical protein